MYNAEGVTVCVTGEMNESGEGRETQKATAEAGQGKVRGLERRKERRAPRQPEFLIAEPTTSSRWSGHGVEETGNCGNLPMMVPNI